MPIIKLKEDLAVNGERKPGQKMTPEQELHMICNWGKCNKRLDRVLKKKPNLDWKNDDGVTALHNAAMAGSPEFVKALIAAKADPNVPATVMLVTPLEMVLEKIGYEEARDDRLNNFDTVMRLDDTSTAVRPNIKPYHEVKKILADAGGIEAKAYSETPIIKPDGSMPGGKASPVRAYELGEDGSYTVAAHLRTGKYDLMTYKDGMLVEGKYDPKTGKWQSFV